MRIRLCGCMALLALLLVAKIFLAAITSSPPPPTFINSTSNDFRAGSAREWLREHEHNQVQLERTILRADSR